MSTLGHQRRWGGTQKALGAPIGRHGGLGCACGGSCFRGGSVAVAAGVLPRVAPAPVGRSVSSCARFRPDVNPPERVGKVGRGPGQRVW